jgi:hypothetical protein
MASFDSVGNYDLTVHVHWPATSGVEHASVAFNCLLLFVGQPDIALKVVGIVSIDAGLLFLSQLRWKWSGSHLEEDGNNASAQQNTSFDHFVEGKLEQ